MNLFPDLLFEIQDAFQRGRPQHFRSRHASCHGFAGHSGLQTFIGILVAYAGGFFRQVDDVGALHSQSFHDLHQFFPPRFVFIKTEVDLFESL